MTLTATGLTTSTPKTTAAIRKAESVISSDFETFLKMLTTQARYQDPLEPIDSSQYSAQLAQFGLAPF
ncbi:flagellar hook capping FlgD N-terminal domain-containing protein [Sulfitobacter sp. SH22]|uniref:flagellar hook capping FlgD N-terminal domain-containing protein n=1 Tax=Sulfitobacter sp. SH22 TaxID=3421172 RepID=UPI003F4F8CD7